MVVNIKIISLFYLLLANGKGLLEDGPEDGLITGWCGKRAWVTVVIEKLLQRRQDLSQPELSDNTGVPFCE